MIEHIEHGIRIGDTILEATGRVVRDPAAWWQHGERGTSPRSGHRIDRLVGHWTAGSPHTGPSAGPKVVRRMRARTRDDGRPLDVGIHFVISWDGLIWQTADLAEGTTHVGHRGVNARSIGVECCWPGTMRQAERLGMTDAVHVTGTAHGQRIACCAPSDELVEAWRWLARVLTSTRHPLLALPMQRGGMTRPGVMEHCDLAGTEKVDAAGLLLGALGLR